MSMLAEQLAPISSIDYLDFDTPRLATAVPELVEEMTAKYRAAKLLGKIAVNGDAEPMGMKPEQGSMVYSLLDGIKLAAGGDLVALDMVRSNVLSDVTERVIKAGHVSTVELQVDDRSRVWQHGQSMETIQSNSIKYASNRWQMRERTIAEANNAFRIEALLESDGLKDNYFVVFSKTADNMSHTELSEVGFFVDSMSCAIQVTSQSGDLLTTQTAFVAGTSRPGQRRHDHEAISAVAASFGIDISGMSATEILDTPLLISKELLPSGVLDLVRLYDDSLGATFFGEAKEKQNYLSYYQKCLDREKQLGPVVDSIVSKLLPQANLIRNEIEAVKLLGKLSEQYLVDRAVVDQSINPRVFGVVAARHIEEARRQFSLGNVENTWTAITEARATAKSSSCPSGMSGPSSESEIGSALSSEDRFGPLEFKCQKGHTNTRPRGKLVKYCKVCHVDMSCR